MTLKTRTTAVPWVVLLRCLLSCAFVLLLSGCQGETTHEEHEEHEEEKVVELPVAKARRADILLETTVPAVASALPDHSMQIAPHMAGKIEKMMIVPGQHVQKNQVVAVLDDSELTAQLKAATTPEKTAAAGLTQARIELDYAAKEAARVEDLYAHDLAAQKDVVSARTLVATSRAKLQAAIAKVEESKASPLDLKAKLEFTRIRSPITGVVAERYLNIGDETDASKPIAHVVDLREIAVDADIPADLPHKVRIGQTGTVRSMGDASATHQGRIIFISPVVDKQKNTIKVRFICPNEEGALKEGQTLTISVVTASSLDALTIPKSALVPDPDDPAATAVHVVQDGKSKRVPVVVGLSSGNRVEIKEGLKEGDSVIVSGSYGLPEGVIVKSTASEK